MKQSEIEKRIRDIEAQLKTLPVGSVVHKTINGKPQPYLQWTEDGHTKSQYLKKADREDKLAKAALRKNLTAELKTLKAELARMPEKQTGPEYRCHIIQGEELRNMVDSVRNLQKRDGYDELLDYVRGASRGVICVLYGLRGTGKTTMMLQAMADLDQAGMAQAVYMRITPGRTMEDLEFDLGQLYAQGYRYVFIDEVTSIYIFQNTSAILSDVYAMQGMKIVVTGAYSLKLWQALSGELYGRAWVIHTTGITFKEYARLFGADDVEKVLHFGGTMRLERRTRDNQVTREEETPFVHPDTTRRYVEAAIGMNLLHSVVTNSRNSPLWGLNQLEANGELTTAANRLIRLENLRFLLAALKREAFFGRPSDDEITNVIVNRVLGMLEDELNNDDAGFDYSTQTLMDALVAMDLFTKVPVKGYGQNAKLSRYMMCTMPGMRYKQLRRLVADMLEDEKFAEYGERERMWASHRIGRIAIDQMLRDAVLWETERALTDDRQVFRFMRDEATVDMVIYSPATDTCEVYVITRSSESARRHRNNPLADSELCAAVEHDYGKITRRCILHSGRSVENRDGIEYKAVEEYLMEL